MLPYSLDFGSVGILRKKDNNVVCGSLVSVSSYASISQVNFLFLITVDSRDPIAGSRRELSTSRVELSLIRLS